MSLRPFWTKLWAIVRWLAFHDGWWPHRRVWWWILDSLLLDHQSNTSRVLRKSFHFLRIPGILVVFPIVSVNENFMRVHYNKLVKVLSEIIIHELHERCWGITQSEWKNLEFKVPIASSKSDLRYRLFVQTYLVLYTSGVTLCEVLCSG